MRCCWQRSQLIHTALGTQTTDIVNADYPIRLRAFEWLAEQQRIHGDVLPRALLAAGFELNGERIPLLGPQGIFRPRSATYPLSVTTTPDSPYDDAFSPDGLLAYRYRGTDANHRDNRDLSQAMADGVPLVYFHGLVPGRYVASWPVYVVRADAASLTFTIAVDDTSALAETALDLVTGEGASARRAYVTAVVRRRLHQEAFRELVLRAYRQQCALCRLRHRQLLDAAHIIEDSRPEGHPAVQNGISLCKLHHAAFDAMIVGITPDYEVEIRKDVLEEADGPMLQHGLKELHTSKLILPRRHELWPDRDALESRYDRFKAAS